MFAKIGDLTSSIISFEKNLPLSSTTSSDFCYKKITAEKGTNFMHLFIFCFKLPFEILSRYDLCDITAESFFFFFLY